MSLTSGQKLTHYEILEPIGKGGMGEVYRARDGKLGRDVAIKVLPEELSRDPERMKRFEREARLLAQLNHSNIATLYGLEESEERQFLVMELVEGETLAERIATGPIPVDEAIPLFIQIAEGLEVAHEKGIVHRDLKPPNIKIGPDGKPKILDFGLAKAFGGDHEAAPVSSQSPTLTKGTALGAILGTASYMSPEQARGRTVDRRTDIWAFGCVLYEALTAAKPFHGDTVTDTLAAIVHHEPDWKALPPETPSSLRRLLKRCLTKDLRQRTRDAWDLRVELGQVLSEPSSVGAEDSGRSGRASSRRARLLAIGALVLAALAGAMFSRAPRTAAPTIRFAIDLPEKCRRQSSAVADRCVTRWKLGGLPG